MAVRGRGKSSPGLILQTVPVVVANNCRGIGQGVGVGTCCAEGVVQAPLPSGGYGDRALIPWQSVCGPTWAWSASRSAQRLKERVPVMYTPK